MVITVNIVCAMEHVYYVHATGHMHNAESTLRWIILVVNIYSND